MTHGWKIATDVVAQKICYLDARRGSVIFLVSLVKNLCLVGKNKTKGILVSDDCIDIIRSKDL